MPRLKIHRLLPKSVLSSRDTARSITDAIEDALRRSDGELALDLEGVLGLAPSFLDELLSIIAESSEALGEPMTQIVFLHPPSGVKEKHHAVCRGHGLSISENEEGDWLITQARQ